MQKWKGIHCHWELGAVYRGFESLGKTRFILFDELTVIANIDIV
jgi:hypothetical protein